LKLKAKFGSGPSQVEIESKVWKSFVMFMINLHHPASKKRSERYSSLGRPWLA